MAAPEQGQVLVASHLSQAGKRFAAARDLVRAGDWEDAISRAYHAAFHAATAALAGREPGANTHRGARTLFALHFIQGGDLPVNLGRALDTLFRARRSGDYDPGPLLDQDGGDLAVSQAQAISAAVRGLLGLGGWPLPRVGQPDA